MCLMLFCAKHCPICRHRNANSFSLSVCICVNMVEKCAVKRRPTTIDRSIKVFRYTFFCISSLAMVLAKGPEHRSHSRHSLAKHELYCVLDFSFVMIFFLLCCCLSVIIDKAKRNKTKQCPQRCQWVMHVMHYPCTELFPSFFSDFAHAA